MIKDILKDMLSLIELKQLKLLIKDILKDMLSLMKEIEKLVRMNQDMNRDKVSRLEIQVILMF